jgi:hypothetical protein
MIQIFQTLELYFNAICGIIAGGGAILLMVLAIQQWRNKNEVSGAMLVACAALCILIAVTGMVTAVQLAIQLKAAG